MMMMARRSGDDGRVTVANSYKKEIGGLPGKKSVRLPGLSPGNRAVYNRAVQFSGTQATG